MGGNLLTFASWRIVYTMTLPLGGPGFILAWWWLLYLRRPERRRLDYDGSLLDEIPIAPGATRAGFVDEAQRFGLRLPCMDEVIDVTLARANSAERGDLSTMVLRSIGHSD